MGAIFDPNNFSKYFDHTNLNLTARQKDIYDLCDQAVKYNFYSVVVYPIHVCECKMLLSGSDVKVSTVVGFPHGRSDTEIKEAELVIAAEQGADEIDLVMDHCMLRAGHREQVYEEIRRLSESAKASKVVLKVIIETSELSDSQKIEALRICEEAEVPFIKTSTGFTATGAVVEDVKMLYENKVTPIKIKASGGIKNLEQAVKLIKAGATRLGCSSSVQIIESFNAKFKSNKVINFNQHRQ